MAINNGFFEILQSVAKKVSSLHEMYVSFFAFLVFEAYGVMKWWQETIAGNNDSSPCVYVIMGADVQVGYGDEVIFADGTFIDGRLVFLYNVLAVFLYVS